MKKSTLFTVFCFGLLLAGFSNVYAQGIMTTWVGNGTGGYSGDGGPSDQAQIMAPNGVCFDPAGNLYISDAGNFAIRKVSAGTNIITTVAGTGQSGAGGYSYGGEIGTPGGVCSDAAGNIYFSDADNNVIHRIDASTGAVTIIAGKMTSGFSGDGGPAVNAQLSYPQGLWYASGAILFADSYNDRIRKINLSTGIITTIAGNGEGGFNGDGGPAVSASLSHPSGVCVNENGYIFIADMQNYKIRKINPSGIISTIAGDRGYGFSGDGGLALNAGIGTIDGITIDPNGNLYIDDVSCSCRKISSSTGKISVVAGSGTASGYTGDGRNAVGSLLQEPAGLCVDPTSGTIIIADKDNNRIRRATQPGYVNNGGNNPVSNPAPLVFPIPSSGIFSIQLVDAEKGTTAEIFSLAGQKVYSTTLTDDLTKIDLSSVAAGAYIVYMKSPSGKAFTQHISVIGN